MNVRAIELLSPAKNLECGIEAVRHGADAVYIGAPRFGARASASNSLSNIEKLVRYAHPYRARVYVALNTILKDSELPEAERLARQLYELGADALIVQDMGILQLNLPPIPLHASTQMDNRTTEKVRFLEQAGFSQVVLARELSLDEIRHIATQTHVTLEAFVHGALCVCYSGQCYISQALAGRSANRGECAQYCRLPYDLVDERGKIIVRNKHLLSLKDLNLSDRFADLLEAGVSSFKIEGRLKDVAYVKNTTAFYRQKLDAILESDNRYRRSSSGETTFFFTPDLAKTFHRGATNYFLYGRDPRMASHDTPKSIGERLGKVRSLGKNFLIIDTEKTVHNGDGLAFFNSTRELEGFWVNRAENNKLFPAQMPHLTVGTTLYRNIDREFEQQLAKHSAERRIALDISLSETAEGFALRLTDEDGISVSETFAIEKQKANRVNAENALCQQLAKLGNTVFEARRIEINTQETPFIPLSVLADWRRQTVEVLEKERTNHYADRYAPRRVSTDEKHFYPETELSYRGNVYNEQARAFYLQHGVTSVAPAFEATAPAGKVALMTCRYCLRHSLNRCPKEHSKANAADRWSLVHRQHRLELQFDCKNCEMKIALRGFG